MLALAVAVMSLAGCTGVPVSQSESVGSLEASSIQPERVPESRDPQSSSSLPAADDTEATPEPAVKEVPLLTRVEAVTFSEQNFTGLGHNCATNRPVWASMMMSNPTTTHISFNPGYRIKAFNSSGKVIWSQDSNLLTDLWPGEAVVTTGIWLCEDLYERVDSIKVVNRGPGAWQPLDNWAGKRSVIEVADVQLILYSVTGGLASDVRATVIAKGKAKVASAIASVVLYDADGRITAIDSRYLEGLKSGAREDVKFLGVEWQEGRPVRAEVLVVPEVRTDHYGEGWDCAYVYPDASPDKSGHYECLEN